jgi:hypothetical protein
LDDAPKGRALRAEFCLDIAKGISHSIEEEGSDVELKEAERFSGVRSEDQ